MKTVKNLCKSSGILFLFGIALSCNPDVPAGSGGSNITDTETTKGLDDLSDQFQFFSTAAKEQGNTPAAAGGSSLKFNIEDTLYLVPGIHMPVKFLHDENTNVAGIYLQLLSVGGAIHSSYYYKVPELQEMAESDTISVVLINFVPADNVELPLSIEVTITPYDESGQPIDETTVPVKVEELYDDATIAAVTCGVVTLDGEYWDWKESYIENPPPNNGTFSFYNDTHKVWGRKGQQIKGSCCAGVSIYGACPGEKEPNTSLHFGTYNQYVQEKLLFYDNGRYARETTNRYANPNALGSDFCGGSDGQVFDKKSKVTYSGDWSIDSGNYLALKQTAASDYGYGNGGGVVHQLSCQSLVLLQHVEGSDLVRIYTRRINSFWNDLP